MACGCDKGGTAAVGLFDFIVGYCSVMPRHYAGLRLKSAVCRQLERRETLIWTEI
jgi:hypothetical protein